LEDDYDELAGAGEIENPSGNNEGELVGYSE